MGLRIRSLSLKALGWDLGWIWVGASGFGGFGLPEALGFVGCGLWDSGVAAFWDMPNG